MMIKLRFLEYGGNITLTALEQESVTLPIIECMGITPVANEAVHKRIRNP